MKLITQRDLIHQVAKRFDEQYGKIPQEVRQFGGGGTFGETIKRLYALDGNTATDKDVAAIIGNDSWTSLQCNECGKNTDAVVEVGEEPDYESATAKLCKECLHKASSLL